MCDAFGLLPSRRHWCASALFHPPAHARSAVRASLAHSATWSASGEGATALSRMRNSWRRRTKAPLVLAARALPPAQQSLSAAAATTIAQEEAGSSTFAGELLTVRRSARRRCFNVDSGAVLLASPPWPKLSRPQQHVAVSSSHTVSLVLDFPCACTRTALRSSADQNRPRTHPIGRACVCK